ncbi:MAG: glycosyltransferase family 2 protein [Phycisphaerae bacterium]|nr:glycosyltransferase family 2 protein [Phycisphaerae bacterium]
MLVSVIIPIRNEEKFIGKCLDSFLPQIESRDDIEILCVNGRSTDKTQEVIDGYSKLNNHIKTIDNPDKIVPTGLNVAIRSSSAKYIMVVGCHAEYAPDYIAKCLEVIQRTNADQVGGYLKTLPGQNTKNGNVIAAATSCIFGIGNSKFRMEGPEQEVDTVPFGMYRREVFDKIGLYDERLVRNQDIELNKRLLKANGKIVISPEIKLSYFNRATYSGLWQQAFNNGLWNPYTIWLTGGGLSVRHFVPMVFVLSLIIFAIASCFYWPISFLLLADVLAYSSLAAIMAIKVAAKDKVSAAKVLWAFLTLHIAYGLGSLWSVITIPFKFPRRNISNAGKPIADRKV